MNEQLLREILKNLKSGSMSIDDVLSVIRNLHYEDISHAKVDHHRQARQGIPEVIFVSSPISTLNSPADKVAAVEAFNCSLPM